MARTAENITFMIIRGVIAMAIVAVGFFCVAKGIHYFVLPLQEANGFHIHLLGLDISASGLGAVIFSAGVALCFVAYRTAPRRFESKTTTETHPPQNASPQGGTPFHTTLTEETSTVLEIRKPPIDIDKGRA